MGCTAHTHTFCVEENPKWYARHTCILYYIEERQRSLMNRPRIVIFALNAACRQNKTTRTKGWATSIFEGVMSGLPVAFSPVLP
jgi:hypothetical protein